jgi:hypothetical protein
MKIGREGMPEDIDGEWRKDGFRTYKERRPTE